MQRKDYQFLKTPDYQKVSEAFAKELYEAANGGKNHLLYIKTYLPKQPIIASGKIQVVVIGGTNYDFAIVNVHDGKREIEFREKGKLPPINAHDDFTTLLDTHLSTKVDGIAVNMGFPLKYFEGEKGQPDGVFIKATKEHSFMALLGHKVGEIVLDRYIRKHQSYAVVAVANDTTCLAEGDGGVIIGTGYNLGLTGEDEKGKYVVNLEDGNSASFESTDELEEIDHDSVNHKSNRFEKMISGYYLPLHFNILAKKHHSDVHIKQAEELAELASTNTDKEGEIARELFDRSARYVAAHIAGLYAFKDKPDKLELAAEGSLFHYGYKYQKTLQQELEILGIKPKTVSFHAGHDSSVLGALKLLC